MRTAWPGTFREKRNWGLGTRSSVKGTPLLGNRKGHGWLRMPWERVALVLKWENRAHFFLVGMRRENS